MRLLARQKYCVFLSGTAFILGNAGISGTPKIFQIFKGIAAAPFVKMKIKIKVIAGAKKEKIEEIEEGYKVHVTAHAVKGKANKALIEFLSGHFGCKKSEIIILKGEQSNIKLVEICLHK